MNFYLNVRIDIYESDTGVKVIRQLNQSVFIFLSALLGSVFGLMGTFAVLLGFIESLYEKWESKHIEKINYSSHKERIKLLISQFKFNPIRLHKVYPYPCKDIRVNDTDIIEG